MYIFLTCWNNLKFLIDFKKTVLKYRNARQNTNGSACECSVTCIPSDLLADSDFKLGFKGWEDV